MEKVLQAMAVVSGLVVSTALTLLVIPVSYSLIERLKDSLFGPKTAPSRDDAALPADATPHTV